MAEQHIGQMLDAIGLVADLDEGDMAMDAIVILKVIKADGSVHLVKGRSDAVDWITALGMVTAAQAVENSGYSLADEDDEP
ncbi:hypothetical protein [Streptomyces qinglanensis]|uniref:Uncharacterized protein n=1 Tax=Streptomyces qinglanensis TaxID=943816 RepID=A0A1H9U350_9ACTN|nr:hypothetical protein [Streptomyces qinglanensis]SES03503.1 hypothetical protein SAMN05421870_107243 [Streptomyces qinglanensis]